MKRWFKLIYTESVRILTDVISGTEDHQHQKRPIQDYQNKDRFSVDRILSLQKRRLLGRTNIRLGRGLGITEC